MEQKEKNKWINAINKTIASYRKKIKTNTFYLQAYKKCSFCKIQGVYTSDDSVYGKCKGCIVYIDSSNTSCCSSLNYPKTHTKDAYFKRIAVLQHVRDMIVEDKSREDIREYLTPKAQ